MDTFSSSKQILSRASELGDLPPHEIRAVNAGWQNGVVDVLTAGRKSRSAGELAGTDGVTPGRVERLVEMSPFCIRLPLSLSLRIAPQKATSRDNPSYAPKQVRAA